MPLPSDAFNHLGTLEEQKEEKQEETQKEEKQEGQEENLKEPQQRLPCRASPQMNLLTTVFRLRRELHRAEEQKTKVRSSRSRRRCRWGTRWEEVQGAQLFDIHFMLLL